MLVGEADAELDGTVETEGVSEDEVDAEDALALEDTADEGVVAGTVEETFNGAAVCWADWLPLAAASVSAGGGDEA